jgi:uncharacterized protein
MLIEFSTENFRSIRDPITLSMVAARGRDLPGACIDCPSDRDLRILKCAAIYGANASGKSNLLMAFRFVVDLVRRGPDTPRLPRARTAMPFRLDPEAARRPCRFECIFTAGEVRLVYGLTARDHDILEEWLHAYPAGRRRRVFERRTAAHPDGASLRFGSSWPAATRPAARSVRPESALLADPSALADPFARSARDWFHEGVRCIGPFPDYTGELDYTTELARIDPEARRRLSDFLKLADLGISDFSLEPLAEPIDVARPGSLPRCRVTLVHEGLSEHGEPVAVPLDSFEEESSGTQKFFALAGPWFHALTQGTLLVIDELDLRLHPLLTRRMIELFYDPPPDHRCGQLVFTTHDSSLLTGEIFRRDQIWFAEKTPEGATSLYSLADFRPRRGENIRAGYLEGRYGAIPFVGDLPE